MTDARELVEGARVHWHGRYGEVLAVRGSKAWIEWEDVEDEDLATAVFHDAHLLDIMTPAEA